MMYTFLHLTEVKVLKQFHTKPQGLHELATKYHPLADKSNKPRHYAVLLENAFKEMEQGVN